MTFSMDVVVSEITLDQDPSGTEYTRIAFGTKIPIPRPLEADAQYPPVPKPIYYKHYAHIFIPREKWTGQFSMWQEFHLIVKDDGSVELKKKEVQ